MRPMRAQRSHAGAQATVRREECKGFRNAHAAPAAHTPVPEAPPDDGTVAAGLGTGVVHDRPHDLEKVGGFTICRTCGAYAKRQEVKLRATYEGPVRDCTARGKEKRRRRDRLAMGQHPLTGFVLPGAELRL